MADTHAHAQAALLAFFDTVRAGDLDTVASYFTQPHVRVRVDDVNERVRNGTTSGRDAWFEPPLYLDFVFTTIARRGHVELLVWFLSQERMAHTLCALLDRIAVAIFAESSAYAREMFEELLSSAVYTSTMTDQDRSDFLTALLRKAVTRGRTHWVEPLLAHGTDLAPYAILPPPGAANENGNSDTVQSLVANGAFLNPSDLVARNAWEGNVAEMCKLLGFRTRGSQECS